MPTLGSPKHKLIAASVLLIALVVLAGLQGLPMVSASRWLLGAAAVAGLAIWMWRTRGTGLAAPPSRLHVLSRAGLSQRCGLALVEADGRTFLVAYGDGFAEMLEAPVKAVARKSRKAGAR
jgi:flagellar protein FliO/FliZ